MGSKDAPQKMQFLGTIKKLASLFPRLQNAKWQKTRIISAFTEPKYVRIPIFLHIPRALEHGQMCMYGFIGKICPGKKLLRFYNPTCTHKKTNYNRFRFPMHFATNRFTFEKFPPPPPLLHPMCCLAEAQGLHVKASIVI